MARRSIEIAAALAWAKKAGYWLIWGSLTMRHNATSDLEWMLEAQRGAWREVVSTDWWKFENATSSIAHEHGSGCKPDCDRELDTVMGAQRRAPHMHVRGTCAESKDGTFRRCRRKWDYWHDDDANGRVGYIRAAELTIGDNGWHPHIHPLIVYKGSRENAQAFADELIQRWIEGIESFDGEAREVGAQQLKVLNPADRTIWDELLGQYVTKQTYDASVLAMEAVWAQNKTAKSGKGRRAKTRPHWSLLAEIAADTGEVTEALERWWELEAASPGFRMITWSRGLRRFAGVGEEQDDQTVAEEVVGDLQDTVCFITPDGWGTIRDEPEVLSAMLDTLATGGWGQLRLLLDALGVEYFDAATLADEVADWLTDSTRAGV